jgi:hypothetical protein
MRDQNKVYAAYKVLRNKIRLTSIEDSLYVIWAYAQNMQMKLPMPPEIELHSQYHSTQYGQRGIYEWDLELLAKEVILHGQNIGYKERHHESFKKISFFSQILKSLRVIDNTISSEYLSPNNVLVEFSRIANRQFPWQQFNPASYLTRFYRIFGAPDVDCIILERTGLTTKEILRIGLYIYSVYLKHPAIKLPIATGHPEFSNELVEKFLCCFASDLPTLRGLVENEQKLDDQLQYCGVAIRYFPLIRMQYRGENCLVCPLPTLLFWRITSGLFYEIFEHKNFSKPFGTSFETYIGDIFDRVINGSTLTALKEVPYRIGKQDKKSVDWILYDHDAGIFVECKTKKMRNSSKTQIDDIASVTADLAVLASSIVQSYKTISDYEMNLYPHFSYNVGLQIYPVIVTIEDWYIFNPEYQGILRNAIEEKMNEKNISLDYLSRMPYCYCSVQEFEVMVQLMTKVGIKNFFEPKVRDLEKNGYTFGTYSQNQFSEHYETLSVNLFEDDYNSLFRLNE